MWMLKKTTVCSNYVQIFIPNIHLLKYKMSILSFNDKKKKHHESIIKFIHCIPGRLKTFKACFVFFFCFYIPVRGYNKSLKLHFVVAGCVILLLEYKQQKLSWFCLWIRWFSVQDVPASGSNGDHWLVPVTMGVGLMCFCPANVISFSGTAQGCAENHCWLEPFTHFGKRHWPWVAVWRSVLVS